MKINNARPVTEPNELRQALGTDADLTANKSLILHCTKCSKDTAGIYLERTNNYRNCPACNSILMYCPICHRATSGTEKFKMLTCDYCKTDFVTETTIEDLVLRDRQAQKIVLSGIRATGRLHLGNYLGAVKQFVEYQAGENLCLYFIADWHTLTTHHRSSDIMNNSVDIAMDYLAAGLNPDQSIIYTQSSVPEIAELALYLSMIQSKSQLEDIPTLKELLKNNNEFISLGHLSYPVLMAADILGPQATTVPVGADQRPNVELARDLARKFNGIFGTTFRIPEYTLHTIKVPGMNGEKMGNSTRDDHINMSDDLDTIVNKYKRFGVTDKDKIRVNSPGNPKQCASVYPLYEIIHKDRPDALKLIYDQCRSGNRGCMQCKEELCCEVDDIIKPFREQRKVLAEKPHYVREVLHFGGFKAREIIRPTLELVREKMGITVA